MSFLIIDPEMVASAAGDLANIGSALSAANATAGPTTIISAASDEVSSAIAELFSGYGVQFRSLNVQLAALHADFVQALNSTGSTYAMGEALSASPLGGIAQQALGALNTLTAGSTDHSAAAAAGATSTTGTTGTTGKVTATYTATSQWGSGFIGSYTITNSGSTPLTNWQLQFNLPANESVTSLWNGQITQSDTQYTVTPSSWTQAIPVGGSVTVGFEASQTGAYSPPTHILVNGQPIAGGGTTGGGTTGAGTTGGGTTGGGTTGAGTTGGGTTGGGTTGGGALSETYTVTSQWGTGFNGSYTITNSSATPVNNWQLQFTLPANESVTSLWNGHVVHSGTEYTVTPESWTQTIAPGSSVTIGFQATETGAYAPPTHVLLNGLAVTTGGTGTGGTTTGGTTGTGGTTTGGTTTGGTTTGGTTTGGTTTGGTGTGGTTTGGTGGSTGTGTGGGVFSPYIDVTLNNASSTLTNAVQSGGVKDVTLAFITGNGSGQPSWGASYPLTDPTISSTISTLHSKGVGITVSFGGAVGQELAATAPNASTLAQEYQSVMNSVGTHKLDFDIEGAAQQNTAANTMRSQALTTLQQQGNAAGTPVQVTYTLPVNPTGLTPDGLGVLTNAISNGVQISHVNIMAMDYGGSFDAAAPSADFMGTYAINAATATHTQLMQLYPNLSSQQVWQMIEVTPMIGVNDDANEIFSLADATQLTTFAHQNHLGGLAMWSLGRDVAGPSLGYASPVNSGIPQSNWAFSQAFEKI